MLSIPLVRRRLLARSVAAREAFTLVEMLLALTLGAIVLGTVTMVGSRLQHQMTTEAIRFKATEQLIVAAELLPLELRGLSPRAGDVAEATDSTIQYRATVANAIVCHASNSSLTVAFFLGGAGRTIAPSVQGDDTLWVFADRDTTVPWKAARITGLQRTTSPCSTLDGTTSSVVDLAHPWTVALGDTVNAVTGALVRLTRPHRLSFYRGSDGRWYLGLRSWNATLGQFNVVQPLSGPYASPARTSGTRFRYFDDAGRTVTLGGNASRGSPTIARVEVLFVADAVPTAADSLLVAIALRNR